MRMVNMLSGMLAGIVRLKNQKDFPLALREIDAAGQTLLGIDAVLIRQCSPAQLMVLLGTDPSLALPRAYILALLLKEESDIRRETGEEPAAAALGAKSLELLLDARAPAGKNLTPEHAERIDGLLAGLSAYSLPAPLLAKVMHYHEACGRYDRAEDVLFDIVDSDPGFAEEGMQFYRRLLTRSDEDLRAGNLPRDEVLEGMADLAHR